MASQQVTAILLLFVYLASGISVTHDFHSNLVTLELLHVVFRHGDRTQDGSYPNDPYANETFYPVGVGELTNAGKIREYNIGAYLRETYNDFLGADYFPGVLKANSSQTSRTKASLQLVLAALYPPSISTTETWNNNLNWQPIPYDYLPASQDMLFGPFSACSRFLEYSKEYQASEAYRELFAPYEDDLIYIKEHSGLTSSGAHTVMSLYSTLKSQEEWGLVLPSWSDSVWPEPISSITKLGLQSFYATKKTRALGAGFLMSKIVNDTKLKLNGEVKDTRIYLYSGHQRNVAAVLSWLGTPDLHLTQYGSFIVFEIHRLDGVPHVRVVYQNYEADVPQVIEIPGCGLYCPLDNFISLYTNYLNPYYICN